MMMKLANPTTDIFVPDGQAFDKALSRTTHLGIGAHADDLEVTALHGILSCYDAPDRWFTGITCTASTRAPRQGPYEGWSDEELLKLRCAEQRAAAGIGRYSAVLQLNHSSKSLSRAALADDLKQILTAARPAVIYTHNLADKHPTHVAVVLSVIDALRALSADYQPKQFFGCEAWRDLDWLPDARKAVLETAGREHLAAALIGVFDSQISGGKRYDLAAAGRRKANATFSAPHSADRTGEAVFAMDLMPLLDDPQLTPLHYVELLIDEFKQEVCRQLGACGE